MTVSARGRSSRHSAASTVSTSATQIVRPFFRVPSLLRPESTPRTAALRPGRRELRRRPVVSARRFASLVRFTPVCSCISLVVGFRGRSTWHCLSALNWLRRSALHRHRYMTDVSAVTCLLAVEQFKYSRFRMFQLWHYSSRNSIMR